MAEISAELVRQLREKTGAGMMDCKKALAETGGDFDKAATLLRQKGVAVAAKRESKAANEGTIGIYSTPKVGVLVELGCETDFVAKTDDFQNLAKDIASQVGSESFCPSCEIVDQPYIHDTTRKVSDVITEIIGKLGEKIVLKRNVKFATENGTIGSYVHTGGKIGVMTELACESAEGAKSADLAGVARDIAMQIAWGTPEFMTREEVPAERIEQEKEIYRQRAVQEGKPEAALEKIVSGRLEKFYSEIVLLDQPFIRDANLTIGDLIKDVAGKIGEKVELKRFTRFRVGEQG